MFEIASIRGKFCSDNRDQLTSRVDQIEAAFKVLQQDVDVRVTHKRGTAVA